MGDDLHRWIGLAIGAQLLAGERSCTSQAPFHAMILTSVCEATYFARYWSGRKITVGAWRLSTTCTAFEDVQQISTSAFTSAEVLT